VFDDEEIGFGAACFTASLLPHTDLARVLVAGRAVLLSTSFLIAAVTTLLILNWHRIGRAGPSLTRRIASLKQPASL